MCLCAIAKYLLLVFNFVTWVGGIASLSLGIYLLVDDDAEFLGASTVEVYPTSAYFLISVGAIAFVIGFLGCKGSYSENTCMLSWYFAIILIIFILQVAVGALIWTHSDEISENYTADISDQILSNASTRFLHMEEKLHCCGQSDGCSDWATANQSAPLGCNCTLGDPFCVPFANSSCFSNFHAPNYTIDGVNYSYVYNQPCSDAMQRAVKDDLRWVVGTCLVIAIVEIFGMMFSCCLCCSIKSEREKTSPTADNSTAMTKGANTSSDVIITKSNTATTALW